METQPPQEPSNNFDGALSQLVAAVVNSAIAAYQTKDSSALMIRDELHRLPGPVMTEVLNGVMLELMQVDPALCRWFILDVFLHDADPEGKADVAERINIMLANLQANGFET